MAAILRRHRQLRHSRSSRTQSQSHALRAVLMTTLVLQAFAQQQGTPGCANPCWTVKDYWPFKTCKAECSQEICTRGWGAYQSQEICCSPGVAFPSGCTQRPSECWVIENYQLRTCIRDDRKCLQGYGVYPTQQACCTPGAAFQQGCRTDLQRAPTPCWVVDTYFPARLCRTSDVLCTPESNVQSWPSQEACCASAFSEGCSPQAPQSPCYVVESYWPLRTCALVNDIATCSRGWGVYQSQEVCCAPGVAFPEGCSPGALAAAPNVTAAIPNNTLNQTNSTLTVPAADAVIAAGAALTAQAANPALSQIPGAPGAAPNTTVLP